VSALANDGNGSFNSTITFGSGTLAGGGLAEDLDGDGRSDVLVSRPDLDGLTLYANNVATSIKPPATPRNFKAEDLQGDLGENIQLTWDRAIVDETTGRITRYLIYRASDPAGPFALIATVDTNAVKTQNGTVRFRTFTDSSATVGQTFYYYAVSRDDALDESAPTDTVSSISTAQPFFDFVFEGNSPFNIRDTVKATVRLVPVGHDVEGFSLYLDYDPAAFTILDGDASVSGLQPVAPDSFIAQNAKVLLNREEFGGNGKISYGVGFLSEIPDAPLAVGMLRLLALKDTTTRIEVENDTSSIRQTAVTIRSDGALVRPYITPATVLVLKNHRINGQVAFQGRTENLDQDARFDLTQSDSLGFGVALADSVAYQPPNDVDLSKSGVQLQLKVNGGFSLEQVPGGTYGLFVKTFHYLRGRVAADSVLVNDTTGVAVPVGFEWISSDSSIISSLLRAGDTNDDNRVDLADFGQLSAQFGASGFDEGTVSWNADFNGDGVVNLADYALLQSNFGEEGMGPSVVAKPIISESKIQLVWDSKRENGVVRLTNGSGIVGFAVDLVAPASTRFHEGSFQFGTYLGGDGGKTMKLVRRMDRPERVVYRIASVLTDGSKGVSGSGDLLLLNRPQEDGSERLRLENGQILGVDGLVSLAVGFEGPVDRASLDRPIRPELFQNVPNPFNPSTIVPFAVSSPSRVTLKVYSAIGQEIRTLVQDFLQPGYHRAVWDGRDAEGRRVASGIYLYQLRMEEFVDVRKAILLK